MDISTRIALADQEYRTLFDLCVKASGAEARQACERRMAEAIFQCFLLRVLRTDNPFTSPFQASADMLYRAHICIPEPEIQRRAILYAPRCVEPGAPLPRWMQDYDRWYALATRGGGVPISETLYRGDREPVPLSLSDLRTRWRRGDLLGLCTEHGVVFKILGPLIEETSRARVLVSLRNLATDTAEEANLVFLFSQ